MAILADGTNLGLTRMADVCEGATLPQLAWAHDWHIHEETYAAALARLIDAQRALPLAQVWGDGKTSSSDGQYFRAGGHGEALADVNARHGDEPGVSFYTHISDRFGPYHTKVIAATASEAPHVLDGLLNHLSGVHIEEHYTDTGGATDHVFGLCHLFGFASPPGFGISRTASCICFPATRRRRRWRRWWAGSSTPIIWPRILAMCCVWPRRSGRARPRLRPC